MIVQLDTENADRDLTSQVTVLTDTPDTSNPMLCQGLIFFGDGTKDLDGSGGDFELTITVGGQTIEPDPQDITFSTATRTAVWTTIFPVPANKEVILKAKSPNGADTDVDVTAYLYDVSGVAGLKASTGWTSGDTSQFDALMQRMFSILGGKKVKDGGDISHKDFDAAATEEIKETISGNDITWA